MWGPDSTMCGWSLGRSLIQRQVWEVYVSFLSVGDGCDKLRAGKAPLCSVCVRIEHLWWWRFAVALWTAFPVHRPRLSLSGFCPTGVSSYCLPRETCGAWRPVCVGRQEKVCCNSPLSVTNRRPCPWRGVRLINYGIHFHCNCLVLETYKREALNISRILKILK